jgi:hypothetical protein
MARSKGYRLDDQQHLGIRAVADHDHDGNNSEAARRVVAAGLRELGYPGGEYRDTRLRRYLRELSRALGYAAVAWLGVTFWFGIELRLPAVVLALGAVLVLAVESVLSRHEPGVSQALAVWRRGDA